jgi:streptomycin 6-kinase
MEDGLLVPAALRASHATYFGNATAAWIRSLPDQVTRWRHEWQLRLDGLPQSGAVALVVPVIRADGTRAVLKLQPVDDETRGEPIALACWAGDGAVRLLESDAATGTMLLERLDARRSLGSIPEARAISVIAGLLRHLNRLPAPEKLRRLDDIANRIVADAPAIIARADHADERHLLTICTTRLAELLIEPVARRLLHWDLHYDNVLARLGNQEQWAAIDPSRWPATRDLSFCRRCGTAGRR